MLCEITQTRKDTHQMFSLICVREEKVNLGLGRQLSKSDFRTGMGTWVQIHKNPCKKRRSMHL